MQTPELWELISFFESEPEASDPEEAEFFDSVSFVRDVGGGELLRCDIGRNFGDLRIALSRDGTERVVLSAEVNRIVIERLHDVVSLVATFGREPDGEAARLTFTPTFLLQWR